MNLTFIRLELQGEAVESCSFQKVLFRCYILILKTAIEQRYNISLHDSKQLSEVNVAHGSLKDAGFVD